MFARCSARSLQLGYDLPRHGVDGDLGTETLDSLARFLRDHGCPIDDDANVVSGAELALIKQVLCLGIEGSRRACG